MKIDWKKISLKDLAGYISKELRKREINTVLVGGACVSIYTKNRYQSYDLDFVSYQDMAEIKVALEDLGFKEVAGYFKRAGCRWIIEFISPPVAVGGESIKKFHKMDTHLGTIQLLTPTDCVKDRLASYFYWDDKEGLEQAILLCRDQKINLQAIKRFASKEGYEKKHQYFLELLRS